MSEWPEMDELIAALTPRQLDSEAAILSERLWSESRRQAAARGPAPARSPFAGSVLRSGELEPVTGCIGSPQAPVCVRAPGGRWTCPACGEQMTVTAHTGPRVMPCTCRGDTACVHPVPLPPRRAFPRARETR